MAISDLMKHLKPKIKKVKEHVKKHHKKYVFGCFSTFAIVKTIILLF